MKFLPMLRLCACSIGLAGLTACAAFKSHKPAPPPEKPTSQAPQLIGRIASIPADKRFVLIQSYGNWKPAAGSILTTRGADDRSANLLITGESLGQFAAADLQSGLVEVGDAVYSRHVPQPATPPPTSEPAENQKPSTTDADLKK